MDIVVKLNTEDLKIIDSLPEYEVLQPEKIHSSGFDGSDYLSLLVPISTITIAYIGKIIIELIKNKRSVEVSYKGTTLKGLDIETTISILEKLVDQKNINTDSPATRKSDENV